MESADSKCARPWEKQRAMTQWSETRTRIIKLKRATCERRKNNSMRNKYDLCLSKYLLYYELFSTLDSESVCLYGNVCTELGACVLLFLVIGKRISCNISPMYCFAKY